MLLISLLLAVLIKQFWEPNNPLHKDQWVDAYHDFLRDKLSRYFDNTQLFTVALSLIAGCVILLSLYLHQHSQFFYILLSCSLLLYSFGRGEYSTHITAFIVSEAKADWPSALICAQALAVDTDDIKTNDWQHLNREFLSQASYLGFERFFAIAFWFALLGPVGAIIYRFTKLWLERWPSGAIRQWLWLLEWPATRVLGLSYAVTGNFTSCIQSWKVCVSCLSRSSEQVLMENVLAALAVDERLPQNQEVTRRELDALQSLLARTLWFWLGAIALLLII